MKTGKSISIVILLTLTMAIAIGCCLFFAQHPREVSNAEESPFVGAGSAKSPYRISDVSDLVCLSSLLSEGADGYAEAYYVLTDDIVLPQSAADDFPATALDIALTQDWLPLGGNATFGGCFDGAGHTISGMHCNASQAGLFAVNDGIIRDLTISDCLLDGQVCGAVAATNTINGCIYRVSVRDSVIRCNESGGGIVGVNYGIVYDLYSSATIYAVDGYAGGLIGENLGTALNFCVTSEVSAASSEAKVAALCGKIDKGYVASGVIYSHSTASIYGVTASYDVVNAHVRSVYRYFDGTFGFPDATPVGEVKYGCAFDSELRFVDYDAQGDVRLISLRVGDRYCSTLTEALAAASDYYSEYYYDGTAMVAYEGDAPCLGSWRKSIGDIRLPVPVRENEYLIAGNAKSYDVIGHTLDGNAFVIERVASADALDVDLGTLPTSGNENIGLCFAGKYSNGVSVGRFECERLILGDGAYRLYGALLAVNADELAADPDVDASYCDMTRRYAVGGILSATTADKDLAVDVTMSAEMPPSTALNVTFDRNEDSGNRLLTPAGEYRVIGAVRLQPTDGNVPLKKEFSIPFKVAIGGVSNAHDKDLNVLVYDPALYAYAPLEYTLEGDRITFETTATEYLIVERIRIRRLIAPIVILSVIFVAALAIGIYLYTRRKSQRPALYSVILLSETIVPTGSIVAVVILGVLACAAVCFAAWQYYKYRKENHRPTATSKGAKFNFSAKIIYSDAPYPTRSDDVVTVITEQGKPILGVVDNSSTSAGDNADNPFASFSFDFPDSINLTPAATNGEEPPPMSEEELANMRHELMSGLQDLFSKNPK